jgi:dCMP deaminase
MPDLNRWDRAHMLSAENYAALSRARRLRVGCVIVKNDRIISIGYNGMPAGWDNDCEVIVVDGLTSSLVTRPEVLHAETNAIAKLASSHESGAGATCFVTHAPCLDCSKLIYQSGLTRVVYRNSYRDRTGLDFLERSGIEVQQCVDV